MSNQILRKDGDLVKISGNYHYKASLSKNKVKRFWYFAKKTAISRFLPPGKNENVLDVGCGSGVITKYLSDFGANAYGIDNNIEAINFAKNKFESDSCRFFCGLVDENYPIDVSMDKIYCLELLY